jgi:Putative Ig domain
MVFIAWSFHENFETHHNTSECAAIRLRMAGKWMILFSTMPTVKTILQVTTMLACCHCVFGADVVIDRAQTFQTITGWGHGGGVLGGTGGATAMLPASVADPVNRQYLDFVADDLGLTGSRTWEVGPRIDGTGMDHGDCDLIDWNLFEGDTLSPQDATNLVYFQNKILAQGIQPNFYSSPGYPTHATDVKPWVLNHPGERARQIWASALFYKTNCGININYAVIYNEPSIASTILADDIKALGPRFLAQGLATRVQYAECVAPQTDWNYITPEMNDADMWPFVGRISYHNYGTADPYRSYLRDYAKAKGLTTAQTEMGSPSFDDLYADLTLAGVSYWEVAYSASVTLVPNAGLTAFTPSNYYIRLRELIHYVRPGAVRIGAIPSDPLFHVLAFSQNGKVTTVIDNTSASTQTVNLSGLPAGNYGVSQAAAGATFFKELGIRTVGVDGALTITNVTGNSSITTVYPYAGTNQPPTIEVWGASPGFLVAPTNSATLSVIANDAELATLTYRWSVTNQPAGANAVFVNSNAPTTVVNGLTVAGTYVFNVNVSDGANISSKQVYLIAYPSTPPPVLGQTGFRISAPYGLVFGDPNFTTHANIELPTTNVTLQAGISDLANSDFTGRGTWTLTNQPAGANAGISGGTVYIFVSIRANVTNMTVPGDYVFQLVVTNSTSPNLTNQIICTVNPTSSPPVISSITATPASVTLPMNSLQLSAITSGSTNQPLRHWWYVKTVPAGAEPQFDHQGATNTTVSNLNVPGNYTFTLRVFDDIHETTQDRTITVNAAPGAPVITSAAAAGVIAGTSFTYTITVSGSPTSFSATNLPPGLTFANGVISGTPTIVGTYNIQLSAANASGTCYGNLALTVKLPLPNITSSSTADGVTNIAFNYTIQATSVPTSFSASGLPAGLALNSLTGTITGTNTTGGIFNAIIIASNSTGATTNSLAILIYNSAPSMPGITSALTATGNMSASFNYQIAATNYPTSFFVIGLPLGLSFDPASGRIFGIPSVTGNFPVTLRAINGGGTGSTNLNLTLNPEPPPHIDSATMQNGFNLSFLTLTNRFYAIEWITNLLNTNWSALTNGIPGSATTQTITDPVTNAPSRFYRIKVTSP